MELSRYLKHTHTHTATRARLLLKTGRREKGAVEALGAAEEGSPGRKQAPERERACALEKSRARTSGIQPSGRRLFSNRLWLSEAARNNVPTPLNNEPMRACSADMVLFQQGLHLT